MKCKKCHREMERVGKDGVYYYRCPSCGFTIGQPKEEQEEKTEENK